MCLTVVVLRANDDWPYSCVSCQGNKKQLQNTTPEINAANLGSVGEWKERVEESTAKLKSYVGKKHKIVFDDDQ